MIYAFAMAGKPESLSCQFLSFRFLSVRFLPRWLLSFDGLRAADLPDRETKRTENDGAVYVCFRCNRIAARTLLNERPAGIARRDKLLVYACACRGVDPHIAAQDNFIII